MLKCNWDVTLYNNAVAVGNYYGRHRMAQVTLWGGGYVGSLGHWFVPVQHRDRFAQKVLDTFLPEIPTATVRVSYPLPSVEDAGEPLFPPYEIQSKEGDCHGRDR
jgi:hypothetical protein